MSQPQTGPVEKAHAGEQAAPAPLKSPPQTVQATAPAPAAGGTVSVSVDLGPALGKLVDATNANTQAAQDAKQAAAAAKEASESAQATVLAAGAQLAQPRGLSRRFLGATRGGHVLGVLGAVKGQAIPTMFASPEAPAPIWQRVLGGIGGLVIGEAVGELLFRDEPPAPKA